MKKILFYVGAISVGLTACVSNENRRSENLEVVIRESEMQTVAPPSVVATVADSVAYRPFYKYVTCQKNDDNGGYEEYRLIMNLYEPNISDGEGALVHGYLALYVKTPENTEGVKVAQRTIERVTQIEGPNAEIEMSGVGEKPVYFGASIAYDSIAHTYQLTMKAPPQLEDLMKNNLTLQ